MPSVDGTGDSEYVAIMCYYNCRCLSAYVIATKITGMVDPIGYQCGRHAKCSTTIAIHVESTLGVTLGKKRDWTLCFLKLNAR